MNLFIFLFLQVIRNKYYKPKRIAYNIILILASLFNSFIIAYAVNIIGFHLVNKYFLIILSTFFAISYFFPSYNLKEKYLPKQLPLSNLQMALIEIGLDIIKIPYYFFVFNFGLWLFNIHSDESFIGSSIVLFSIHFLVRIFQTGEYFHFRLKIIFYTIFTFISSIFIFFTDNNLLIFNLFSFLFFIFIYINIEKEYALTKEETYRKKNIYYVNLYIAIIIKLIFLIFFILIYLKNIENWITYFGLILLTPVLLFNYIFNNTFGYFPKIFLNLIYFGNNKQIINQYLKLLMKPFIIDISILLSFLFIIQNHYWLFIIMYLSSVLVLFPTGLILSFKYPKKMSNKFSFDSRNPMISQIITLLISTIIVLPYFNMHYFFLYLLFPIYLIFLFVYLKNKINTLKNNTHPKL